MLLACLTTHLPPIWTSFVLALPHRFCDDGECRYPYRNYGDSVLDTPGVYWQAASVLMAIGCGMAILNAVTAVMALCAPYVVPSFVRTCLAVVCEGACRYSTAQTTV